MRIRYCDERFDREIKSLDKQRVPDFSCIIRYFFHYRLLIRFFDKKKDLPRRHFASKNFRNKLFLIENS